MTQILDFGQHPYADTFISQDQLHLSEPIFPLQVCLDTDSGHINLRHISSAQERYNLYNYSYTSSNSMVSRNHWTWFANTIKKKYSTSGLVIEIGSNDGFLIKQFQQTGTQILGVDSSQLMCDISISQGIDTVCELFNHTSGQQLQSKYGNASVVIANNVFNHANDPVDFARGVAELLTNNGVFVFEVPYWLSMVQSDRFTDMVYHEHVSYFTVKSLWNILQQAGLQIIEFDIVDYHGGSLHVVAQRTSNNVMPDTVTQAIAKETQAGIFDIAFYQRLQNKFKLMRNQWMLKFYQLLDQDPNAVIIGVGAAAKANTWLTWHGINATHLYCITDSSKHKQGKYTPLSRILILDDLEFAKHNNPYALILSWNISNSLKHALLNINPNIKFISQ